MTRKKFIFQINELCNKLPEIYPELEFQNHCYRRIAYDNALGLKWSDKYNNFVKESSLQDLALSIFHLKSYVDNKEKLLDHNKQSLKYRKINELNKTQNNS